MTKLWERSLGLQDLLTESIVTVAQHQKTIINQLSRLEKIAEAAQAEKPHQ